CSNAPALACWLKRPSSAPTSFSSAAVRARVLRGGAAAHPTFATASSAIALSQRMSSLLGLDLERQRIHGLDAALHQRPAHPLHAPPLPPPPPPGPPGPAAPPAA